MLDEGDEVLLKAKVFRANGEQAFIEFMSMEGSFSVRVPVHELTRDHSAVLSEARSLADIYATGQHAEDVLARIRSALN